LAREQRGNTRGNTRDNRRDNFSGDSRETPYRRGRRKRCRFCMDKTDFIDYKSVEILRSFVTDRGKILPRRVSGNCAKHQREVTRAIKRARNIALVPFTTQQ
jgi:small subunit ribosomal protein S18